MPYNTSSKNQIIDTKYNLTKKQLEFCLSYVECGIIKEAAIRAGYSEKTAQEQGSRLLKIKGVKDKIYALQHDASKCRIATATEVMDFFTKVMNGEVQDQFGIEASLGDRLKAANELAKRTVDIEQRATEKSDNEIHIKLDWGMDNGQKEEE